MFLANKEYNVDKQFAAFYVPFNKVQLIRKTILFYDHQCFYLAN